MIKPKLKNILIINVSSVIYGAESRMLDLIHNLDKDKYRIIVLLAEAGPLSDRLKEMGITTGILDFNFHILRSPITKFFRITKEFVRLVRKHDIDLIHCNLHIKISNFWLAFLWLRKPIVVHMRNHFYIRPFEKFVLCRTSKLVCVSKFVKRSFLKQRRSSFLMRHKDNHCEVVYDGIDVGKFTPKPKNGEIRSELSLSQNDFLVSIIGAIDRVKGQDLLVRAARIIVDKHPNTKFLIIGDFYGNSVKIIKYYNDLLELIKELDLSENVIFTGFRSDIDKVMNDIDVLVQPSVREGLGTSMVEAMSCGRAVIGTNVDGIPEVIGNNEGGLLLDPRTPEKLAESIMMFIESPEALVKRGHQGRERVLKMFDARKNIERIEEIYQEALK